jgi:hypothetical protein
MPIILDGTAGITTPAQSLSSTTLGTAVAGTMEWDSKVPYFTPQGTQRGVIPGMQYYRLDSNYVGANATGAQSIFGVGATLSANTVYVFQLQFTLNKTAGATSHNISYGYGGTATVNNVYINLQRVAVAGSNFPYAITSPVSVGWQNNNTTASTQATGSIANANAIEYAQVTGTISINAGGTFIPQYTLSAAPGGAYSTVAGSFCLIYPIGASGSNVSVGTWA